MDFGNLYNAVLNTFFASYVKKTHLRNIRELGAGIEKLKGLINNFPPDRTKELGKCVSDAEEYIFNVYFRSGLAIERNKHLYDKICKIREDMNDIRLETLEK